RRATRASTTCHSERSRGISYCLSSVWCGNCTCVTGNKTINFRSMKSPVISLSILFTSILFGVAATAQRRLEIIRSVPVRTPAPAPKAKETAKVFIALPNYDEETATRLQIFLDNNDFGPGKIDGKMGEFFRKALVSYKHARAMPITGVVDQ